MSRRKNWKICLVSCLIEICSLSHSHSLSLSRSLRDTVHLSVVSIYEFNGLLLGSTYFRHTLRFAAHWIVVAFTLERLIVVYFPLQTSVLCNPRSARRICLIILIISFLVPFYSFLMSDVSVDEKHNLLECDIVNKFKKIYFYLTIVYGNLTLTFPILIVCVVNILTVRQLLRAGRLRKKQQQQQQQLSHAKKVDSANNEYVNMIVKNQLENDKVTWMLVVISITFGILNFPYFILWLIVCIIRVRGKTPSLYIESAKMVAEVFYLLNYSLYFFLYVISRRSFRKVLIEKMRWRCDCFDQWRLNEMRLDAAIRSQQIPAQVIKRNGNADTSVTSRTSLTNLRPVSTRRVLSLPTKIDASLMKTREPDAGNHLMVRDKTNGIGASDLDNSVWRQARVCALRLDDDRCSRGAFLFRCSAVDADLFPLDSHFPGFLLSNRFIRYE